jgi:Tfp pilus assembly protein PilN
MEQLVNLYQPILGAEKRLFSAYATLVGLGLLALCLAVLAGYGAWHTAAAEAAIARLEQQQGQALERTNRAGNALRPSASLPELDAQSHALAVKISARERALDAVHRGAASATAGFAARLEALAHSQYQGVWLRAILLGDGQLAMRGATVDSAMVPGYISALAAEPALAGVQFDRLSLHRGLAADAPASILFELDAPELGFDAAEGRK